MTEENHARDQARSQLEGISEMLAALNVDYDRLDELWNELDGLQQDLDDAIGSVEAVHEGTTDDSVDEECAALNEAADDLYTWGKDNHDEFSQLKADAGDCESREDAEQRIQEDPLSVQVRSCWHSPDETSEPCEFEILLCTGGPAVRIIGELDEHNQPASWRARLEYQDWFTPWTDYYEPGISETLVEYAQQFYFGE